MRFRALLTSVALIAACGGDGSAPTVTDAWARASAPGQTSGAVYLTVTSPIDDVLLGAAVPESIAGSAELHQTTEADSHDMSGMTDEEMAAMHEQMMGEDSEMDESDMSMSMAMTMLPVSEIAVPSGGSIVFEPGGYHVMMNDLVALLEVGQRFQVTLHFEKAGDVIVDIDVREDAP
jgi:copper(I)-binding protein